MSVAGWFYLQSFRWMGDVAPHCCVSESQGRCNGKKEITKLHQKSLVYVLKYVTHGFRILHPLLLSRQLFSLFPDNTNVGIV